ncbi:hypothetical protein K438DRAFT_1766530 [Mycena galopus ATCC 62051]|nr:hypothetical protein K438DRAFT_1766530 [Mycena galopus ATCC 62051]
MPWAVEIVPRHRRAPSNPDGALSKPSAHAMKPTSTAYLTPVLNGQNGTLLSRAIGEERAGWRQRRHENGFTINAMNQFARRACQTCVFPPQFGLLDVTRYKAKFNLHIKGPNFCNLGAMLRNDTWSPSASAVVPKIVQSQEDELKKPPRIQRNGTIKGVVQMARGFLYRGRRHKSEARLNYVELMDRMTIWEEGKHNNTKWECGTHGLMMQRQKEVPL